MARSEPTDAPTILELTPRAGTAVDPLVDIGAEDRPGTDARPWVFTNMVSSLDGATAVDGLSGALGGRADKLVFQALRSVASVILVGASTVRDEGYRPPDPGNERRSLRRSRSLPERAAIAVISSSLDFPDDLPLLSDPSYRPLVITTRTSPAERRSALGERAEVIVAGDDRVDLRAAVSELGRRGHRSVLAEGGPALNGQLVAAGLVDEWNLTLSPALVGGPAARAAHGSEASHDRLRLARMWMGDDLLFGRWVRT